MTNYQEMIKRQCPELSERECAYVQAWMLLEHHTLNSVPTETFRREVTLSVLCLRQSTLAENEALAATYDL